MKVTHTLLIIIPSLSGLLLVGILDYIWSLHIAYIYVIGFVVGLLTDLVAERIEVDD